MRRLDALVIKELIGPWVFGVAIFTVLIMAGTYLFKITDYLVSGVGTMTVLELSMLLLPGVIAKTFPMAVLLAALLAFGRLSSDSEIVALKAAGISVARIMLTVAMFGGVVALIAFGFNETLVPSAAARAYSIQTAITAKMNGSTNRPIQQLVYDKGKLVAMISARDFSFASGILRGVTVTSYGGDQQPTYVLLANELEYKGERDWRLTYGGILMTADGEGYIHIMEQAWPKEIARPELTPQDLLAKTMRELDALSMRQMGAQIQRDKLNPSADPGQIANLEYGYWNKLALPLASVVYALVGAPLGIRNHRTGAAAGFWLSVIIIFGYMMLANWMNVYAQGGKIPAYVASFTPLAVGLIVAVIAIQRKST